MSVPSRLTLDTSTPVDHWKIVGPISVFGRRYATFEDAEAIRKQLPDPDAHHLRAYNAAGKVVFDERRF